MASTTSKKLAEIAEKKRKLEEQLAEAKEEEKKLQEEALPEYISKLKVDIEKNGFAVEQVVSALGGGTTPAKKKSIKLVKRKHNTLHKVWTLRGPTPKWVEEDAKQKKVNLSNEEDKKKYLQDNYKSVS